MHIVFVLKIIKNEPVDNDDSLAPNPTANFVPCSILDVDR